jgi:hypothetical protein
MKYSATISIGNIIQIILLVIGAFAAYGNYSSVQSTNEARLLSVERTLNKQDAVNDRIQETLQQILIRLGPNGFQATK